MNADLYTHRNSAPAITITSATAQQLSAISVDNNNTKRPDPPRKKWSTTTIPVLSSLDESLILGHHATFGTYRQSFDLSGYMDENRSLNTSESNLSETTNSTSSITGEYEKYKNSRRKSWHVGKRRKSVMGVSHVATISPPSGFDRKHGKRGSWWSLLVPESWPRTRRASTVGIDSNGSRHDDNIPYHRNKSRSVDHGFASPFDLDSLRSKVEGRFESVDKLHSDGDSASKENIAGKMQKPSEPIKTTTYTVEASDTLSAVAARFDTTPSELAILNRLTSRTVFPGQTIRVPEKTTKRQRKARVLSENQTSSGNEEGEGTEDGDESGELESETNESDVSSTHRRLSANECESTEECELLESLRPASPKPGHVERIRAPLGASYANRPRHAAPQERFLKIHVRHITDGQGVVAGVLLVTPNAVMFDPNVSDTLVIEHGAEAYGVIAPMEFVVNAAIYHDIAHMRVAHIQQKHDPNVKQEIYHLKHRDSISAEGGANLYRSTEKEEEEEKEEKEEHTKENEGEEDRVNVQNEVESTKPVSQTSDDTCSCGGGEEPPTSSPPHSPPTSTPPNTSHSSTCEDASSVLDAEQIIRKLEERRQSSLDHHWPVPRSYVMEQQALSQEKMDEVQPRPLSSGPASSPSPSPLVKTDCHDSGIDIRDPGSYPGALPTPPPRKAAYSDADILLSDSNEFIPPMPILPLPSGADDRRKAASVSFQVDQSLVQDPTGQAPPGVCDKQETKKKNMLKRLSYPLAWMEGFSSDKEDKESLPSSGDSSQPASSHSSSVFSKVFSRRPSVSTFIRSQHSAHSPQRSVSTSGGAAHPPPPPKLNYHSMVSVDDMPELFVAFDKLIPRPARSCDDPPLYLRLRMGKPKHRPISRSTPIMSYGKKKMRPEYWFSVPRNRVDELYKFLMLWVPHLYGDLDEAQVNGRGFELVDSDTELWEEEGEAGGSPRRRGSEEEEGADPMAAAGELGRESWEVIKAPYTKLYTILKSQADQFSSSDSQTIEEHPLMCEELRRALYANPSLDFDLCVPDLNGVTEILTEDHRKDLCRHLPARAEGYTWTLVFSTSQHGFSLSSLYRKMSRIESPILLVIQDTDCNVFGALTSCSLKTSDHFYGTGESLLFSFTPDLQVYNWTGDNMYFIKGNNESLSIGAGDGKFGLWLDGDLYQGRSEPCSTYGNEPLSPQQDFVVKTLECWAFI